MRTGRIAICGALVALGAFGRAGAQELMGPATVREPARQTIGASLSMVDDSNVARADAATAAAEGIIPHDQIAEPLLSFDVLRPFAGQSIFLNGTAGYEFYRRNSVLDAPRIDLHGGVKGRLSLCQETFETDYAILPADLQQPGLLTVKNLEQRIALKAGGACGRRYGLAPAVAVSEVWDTNSAGPLRSQDYRQFSAVAGALYRRPVLGAITAFGAFDRTDFTGPPPPTGPARGNGYETLTAGVRHERALGTRLSAQAMVAYNSLRPDLASAPGFNGFTYNASLSYRLTSRFSARAASARELEPGHVPGATFTLNRTASIEATYALSHTAQLSLGASRTNQRSQETLPGLPLGDVTVTTDDIYGSARFQLNRRVFLQFEARQEYAGGTVAAFRYSETRVSLTAGTRF